MTIAPGSRVEGRKERLQSDAALRRRGRRLQAGRRPESSSVQADSERRRTDRSEWRPAQRPEQRRAHPPEWRRAHPPEWRRTDRRALGKGALGGAAFALALALSLTGVGCAHNPATGKGQPMPVSEELEIRIGKEADRQVREEFGIYSEKPALSAHVAEVGKKLAARSDRPRLTYQYEIVDTADINAFALPGGYVYVTRGLLARLNSEDELAAVLGHETAHVAARHGSAQLSGSDAGRRALAEGSRLPGDRAAAPLGELANAAFRLALQGHPQDEEREADDLGTKYATRAGYSPLGASELMETLGRIERKEPALLELWFASHPGATDRSAHARDQFRAPRGTAAAQARPLRRDPYLEQIDGIALGESNGSASIAGSRYLNKRQQFSLEIPAGWSARLRDADLVMARPSEGFQAEVKVQSLIRPGVSGDVAREYARRAAQEGAEVSGPVTKATVPAGEGALVTMRAKDLQGNATSVRKMFLVRFDQVYVLTFTVPEGRAEAALRTFMDLTASIKLLTGDDVAGTSEPRLGVRKVVAGDTWSSLAATIGSRASGSALAAYNGREEGEEPRPGALVKIPPLSAFEWGIP